MFDPSTSIPESYVVAVLRAFRDGFAFEDLLKRLLVSAFGSEAQPVGGIHDGGQDFFVFHSVDNREIFQISIRKDWKAKIFGTISRLKEKGAEFEHSRLTYISNQDLPHSEIESIVDEVWQKRQVTLKIVSLRTLTALINSRLETRKLFLDYCSEKSVHQRIDEESLQVFGTDKIDKTLLYLRHFIEEKTDASYVDSLVRTHLFIFLGDTDPDAGEFRTFDDIAKYIGAQLPDLSSKDIRSAMSSILLQISRKPKDDREIRDHGNKGLCAAWDVRKKLKDWSAKDILLYGGFTDSTKTWVCGRKIEVESPEIAAYLPTGVRDVLAEVFRTQGLEVLTYLKRKRATPGKLDLAELCNAVAGASPLAPKYHHRLAHWLSEAVYDVFWTPTKAQSDFCEAMARAYSLMFLGKADPQVLGYLKSTAEGLTLIVGTDVLVRALAETYLDAEYQRYRAFLESLRQSGVTLIVTDGVLRETSSHIRGTEYWYEEYIVPLEGRTGDDFAAELIDYEERYSKKILIRAYHYSKTKHNLKNFSQFLRKFLGPDPNKYDGDLRAYIEGEFGIQKSSTFFDEKAPQFDWLLQILEKVTWEGHDPKTRSLIIRNDALTIRTVYDLRERQPKSKSRAPALLPQNVWWLTSETKTEKLRKDFETKFDDVPHLHPSVIVGLLFNLPSLQGAQKRMTKVLASAIGLNMSHWVADDIIDQLVLSFREIETLSAGEKALAIKKVIDKMRGDEIPKFRQTLDQIFDSTEIHEKTLNQYHQTRANYGLKEVWKQISKEHSDPITRVLIFSEIHGDSRVKAVQFLKESGFEEDARKFTSTVLNQLIDRP